MNTSIEFQGNLVLSPFYVLSTLTQPIHFSEMKDIDLNMPF